MNPYLLNLTKGAQRSNNNKKQKWIFIVISELH